MHCLIVFEKLHFSPVLRVIILEGTIIVLFRRFVFQPAQGSSDTLMSLHFLQPYLRPFSAYCLTSGFKFMVYFSLSVFIRQSASSWCVYLITINYRGKLSITNSKCEQSAGAFQLVIHVFNRATTLLSLASFPESFSPYHALLYT